MKKIKVEYNQLMFLYAYLRLINLSLDRSRWTTWSEFQLYYKDVIQPDKVIQYLESSFQLPENDLAQSVLLFKKEDIADVLAAKVFKRFFLRQSEVLYCYKLLRSFENFLNSNSENYNMEMEMLRCDIAEYYRVILEKMISRRDLYHLMKIEHYGQSEHLRTIKLDEFVPSDFL